VQDGRIYIKIINGQFLFKEGGTPEEYSTGLACSAIKRWLWKHESGTYVKFTPVGADDVHVKADGPQNHLLGAPQAGAHYQ
jgi:hypothetical protein